MSKVKILFVCIHNSARSQMAEAWMNHLCGDFFEASSAGIEPGRINPLTVEVMAEVGIDLSQKGTQSVFGAFKSGIHYGYTVTVCDESNAERCPIFPGTTIRLHWGFRDPAASAGTHEERLAVFREVRDEIRARIESWCAEQCVAEAHC